MKFLPATMISMGFMNSGESILKEIKHICDFLGKKITSQKYRALVAQFHKFEEDQVFICENIAHNAANKLLEQSQHD